MLASLAQRPSLWHRSLLAVLATGLLLGWTSQVYAYRPFDGTDAAVADPGEVEVELQPAGAQWSREQNLLIAPAVVFNYGLTRKLGSGLRRSITNAVLAIRANGPVRVWRFSEAHGPAGRLFRIRLVRVSPPNLVFLFPDSHGDSRFGASFAGIVSERWDWGTVHLNIAGELTRDQRADLFSDLILEGPSKWVVRPVAEFFYEEEFGRAHTLSGLVGAIWQVNDKLSFDIGFRHAITNGTNVNEIRAGLTVGFMTPFGRPDHKR